MVAASNWIKLCFPQHNAQVQLKQLERERARERERQRDRETERDRERETERGVSTYKNKNTDHRVKETCTTMSIQVTYETYHMSLLHDSTMSNVLHFCFFMLFYCNLKEKDHIRRIIKSKNRNIYKWNQYYYYFDLPKIRVGRARTTKT